MKSAVTSALLLCALALAAAALLVSFPAGADSRTSYLVDLLKNSGNYRVRLQAAETLGKIGAASKDAEEKKKILDALTGACADTNDLVKMTAAAALGLLGDPAAIPALEKLGKQKVKKEVKDQAAATLEKLKAIAKVSGGAGAAPGTGAGTAGGTAAAIPAGAEAKDSYYVGIGTWGDKSGYDKVDALGHVKKTLAEQLDQVPGVKLTPQGESKDATEKFLKKSKLVHYVLTGSVGKVKLDGEGGAAAEISVIVLDGEGNMRMMLKGKGGASMGPAGAASEEKEKGLVLSALDAAVKSAVEPFSAELQKQASAAGGDGGAPKKGKKKGKEK